MLYNLIPNIFLIYNRVILMNNSRTQKVLGQQQLYQKNIQNANLEIPKRFTFQDGTQNIQTQLQNYNSAKQLPRLTQQGFRSGKGDLTSDLMMKIREIAFGSTASNVTSGTQGSEFTAQSKTRKELTIERQQTEENPDQKIELQQPVAPVPPEAPTSKRAGNFQIPTAQQPSPKMLQSQIMSKLGISPSNTIISQKGIKVVKGKNIPQTPIQDNSVKNSSQARQFVQKVPTLKISQTAVPGQMKTQGITLKNSAEIGSFFHQTTLKVDHQNKRYDEDEPQLSAKISSDRNVAALLQITKRSNNIKKEAPLHESPGSPRMMYQEKKPTKTFEYQNDEKNALDYVDEGDLSLITYRQTIVDTVENPGSPEKIIDSQTIKKIAEIVGGMKETVRKRKYPLQLPNKVTEREEGCDSQSGRQKTATNQQAVKILQQQSPIEVKKLNQGHAGGPLLTQDSSPVRIKQVPVRKQPPKPQERKPVPIIIEIKPSVTSNAPCHPICAFGVNTNASQSANAKDQIAVALNIKDPLQGQSSGNNSKDWPTIKYFGVYSANDDQDLKNAEWAEFMKHNFHRELSKRREFFQGLIEKSANSTYKACKAAFNLLREQEKNKDGAPANEGHIPQLERDLGLSAMMAVISNNDIHIAGAGNFQALISTDRGQKIQIVRGESQRDSCGVYLNNNDSSLLLDLGLSQSSERIKDKLIEQQQMTSVFSLTSLKKDAAMEIDFIIIASQSAFDLLGLEKVRDRIWGIINEQKLMYIANSEEALNLHQVCGKVAEDLMKDAIREKTDGNISVIMIAFKQLEDYYQSSELPLLSSLETSYKFKAGKTTTSSIKISQASFQKVLQKLKLQQQSIQTLPKTECNTGNQSLSGADSLHQAESLKNLQLQQLFKTLSHGFLEQQRSSFKRNESSQTLQQPTMLSTLQQTATQASLKKPPASRNQPRFMLPPLSTTSKIDIQNLRVHQQSNFTPQQQSFENDFPYQASAQESQVGFPMSRSPIKGVQRRQSKTYKVSKEHSPDIMPYQARGYNQGIIEGDNMLSLSPLKRDLQELLQGSYTHLQNTIVQKHKVPSRFSKGLQTPQVVEPMQTAAVPTTNSLIGASGLTSAQGSRKQSRQAANRY